MCSPKLVGNKLWGRNYRVLLELFIGQAKVQSARLETLVARSSAPRQLTGGHEARETRQIEYTAHATGETEIKNSSRSPYSRRHDALHRHHSRHHLNRVTHVRRNGHRPFKFSACSRAIVPLMICERFHDEVNFRTGIFFYSWERALQVMGIWPIL